MPGRATAIVLAAGESRRMAPLGMLKPLLPYGSGTVIGAVVRSLKASPVERVLVVAGPKADEIAAALEGTGAELVRNPRYPEGMLTSVQAGVAAAAPGTEWLVLALGDQPWLKAETVRTLLEAAEREHVARGAGIVVPSYAMRRGHPLVIHAAHRAEIAALSPEVGLRELLKRHPEALYHVEFSDPAVLGDMDTPEDYRRALQALEAAAPESRPDGSRAG